LRGGLVKRVREHLGRAVSCVLSLVLLTSPLLEGAPAALAAPPLDLPVETSASAPPVEREPSPVEREIVEKRTEDSKHYEHGTLRSRA
jgi:hypothetical protein